MRDTKLILIEGLPGAGKSTTTRYLQNALNRQGIECRGYLEDERPHPIDCLDFAIEGLPERVIPLWENFVRQARKKPAITILESRLWQSTGLYMYMGSVDEEEIVDFTHQVYKVIYPLFPILIHLDQDDTETALKRLYALRGKEWMDAAIAETLQYSWFQPRDDDEFTRWVKFFEAWGKVAARLFDDWRGGKIRIMNPHEDWDNAHRQILSFIQTD